jgi:hypothetical protein
MAAVPAERLIWNIIPRLGGLLDFGGRRKMAEDGLLGRI